MNLRGPTPKAVDLYRTIVAYRDAHRHDGAPAVTPALTGQNAA